MASNEAAATMEPALLQNAKGGTGRDTKAVKYTKAKAGSPTASSGKDKQDKQQNKLKNDNAVTLQLTKTKMCAFFQRGKCASTSCGYAHSVEELRPPPNLQKTKLCRAFLQGNCSDENCVFAHSENDLRVTDGIYKTQICNFYERGYCKKGERCNHAHGIVELRTTTPLSMTPMSKTSPLSGGDSSRQRRSPLPLAALLVDSEGNSTVAPSPTKSITELASLSFSPMPSSPLWGQYGMHPLSPSAYGGDLSAMWLQEPIDMLVDQHAAARNNLLYAMDVLDRSMDQPANQLSEQPLDQLLEQPPDPSLETPLEWCPGGEKLGPGGPAGGDPLNERLASLDAVVRDLAADIADLRIDQKQLHRI